MAINVQRIVLTHEKLHFLYCLVRRAINDLINVFGPFSVIFAIMESLKVEVTYISSARKTAKKSQKYFVLLALN